MDRFDDPNIARDAELVPDHLHDLVVTDEQRAAVVKINLSLTPIRNSQPPIPLRSGTRTPWLMAEWKGTNGASEDPKSAFSDPPVRSREPEKSYPWRSGYPALALGDHGGSKFFSDQGGLNGLNN
jgi:hypothetical protein